MKRRKSKKLFKAILHSIASKTTIKKDNIHLSVAVKHGTIQVRTLTKTKCFTYERPYNLRKETSARNKGLYIQWIRDRNFRS